jgi:hypothetical protein
MSEATLHCFAAWAHGSYDPIIDEILTYLLKRKAELFPNDLTT